MNIRTALPLIVASLSFTFVASLSAQQKSADGDLNFALHTSAFANDTYIPAKYGCDIPDAQGTPMISPPLQWANAPKNTASFALIMHDIGADPNRVLDPARLDVTHWVIYDIPPNSKALPEGIAADAVIPGGGIQGANVHDVNGYQAP